MIKIYTLYTFLFFAFSVQAQFVIKGNVCDEYKHGVPGVRVAIDHSTYGVPTNAKGAYFLELEQKGQVVVTYSMLGFTTKIDTINIEEATTINNVVLIEEATALSTVEIYADKRDIAKEVMKSVIDNKKKMKSQYDTYQCYTYIKTTLEKENRIPLFKKEGEEVGRQKMNFIESYSISKYKANNTYKEEVLAHHDFSEKS